MPAPILRQHYPVDPELLPDRTLRQAEELLEFNGQTGAMDAFLEELLLLHEQFERTLREQ